MARKHIHHGGAWKVAYADFVTAMMALFLVLWLTSQDEKIKEAVERSFKNPFSSLTKDSTGVIPTENAVQVVRSQQGNFDSASAVELNMLRRISQDLIKTFQQDKEEENPVKIETLPDGVRINVFDRAHKPIFQQDSADFTDYGKWVFTTLAWQVSRYPKIFHVEVEGHTEANRPARDHVYGNWEISSDRANTARRLLEEHGVKPGQVRKVAGYADTQPMPEVDATDERNRRVALLLRVDERFN